MVFIGFMPQAIFRPQKIVPITGVRAFVHNEDIAINTVVTIICNLQSISRRCSILGIERLDSLRTEKSTLHDHYHFHALSDQPTENDGYYRRQGVCSQ